jgi:alpha-galactosidase
LGFDIVVSKLEEKELAFCQEALNTYNGIKQIIWQGDQYRLQDPFESSVASVMYVDGNKTSAVVFNYLVGNRYGDGSLLPVKLKGLDGSKKYAIRELNIYPGTKSSLDSSKVYSGEFLMTVGFNPDVKQGRNSVVLEVKAVN